LLVGFDSFSILPLPVLLYTLLKKSVLPQFFGLETLVPVLERFRKDEGCGMKGEGKEAG
jgi:hypothetical protein